MERGEQFMSQIIDKRVVEMRFDNKQFESGIKESLTSLDNLKSKLNLEGSAKSFETLDKAANSVKFNGIASGVEALQKRFSTFGIVGMRVIENVTDSLMNMTSRAAGFMTDSIISGGLKRSQNIENAHFSLQSLLKDEEKVQAVMDNAMVSVDGTAYAYDEAAKAASQFAASGIEAGEEMERSLKGITGVAAMTNSEYESISMIFTTVAGNGRLMGDQLLQLSSRGLNAASTIADYFREVQGQSEVTEATIREMVTAGEIDFDTFASAMEWAFGESAFRANETFTGAFANMKSALARIGADFFSPLIEQNSDLILLINTMRERINDVKSALTFNEQKSAISGLAKVTGFETDKLEELFNTIDKNSSVTIDNINELSDNGADAIGSLTKYINGVLDGSIRANDVTKNTLNELTGGMKVNSSSIKQFVREGKIDLGTFTHAMETAYGDQEALSKSFTDNILNMAKSASEYLKNVDMSKPMYIFYNGVHIVENLFKGLYSVIKPLGTAFGDVFLSFSIDDAMSVADTLEKISSKMRLSEENSQDLHDAFEGLFSVVNLLVRGLFGLFGIVVPISEPVGTLGDGMLSLAGSAGRSLTEFTEWINKSPMINKAYGVVSEGVQELMSGISDFLKSFNEFNEYVSNIPFVQKSMELAMKGFDKAYEKTRKGLGALIDEVGEFGDWIMENSPDSAIEAFEGFLNILEGINEVFMGMLGINPFDSLDRFVKTAGKIIETARKNNEGFDTFLTNMSNYSKTFSEFVNFDRALDNISAFMDVVGKFVDWIQKTVGPVFKDFSIGSVVATGGGIGMIYAIIKMAKGFDKIGDTLSSIPELLESVKGTLKAWQTDLKADAMLKIAGAVAILAGALTILSFADTDKIYASAIALGLIGVALTFAVGYLSNAFTKTKEGYDVLNTLSKGFNNLGKAEKWKAIGNAIKQIGNTILKIVASIVIIAYAYSKDSSSMDHAIKLVGIIAASVIGIVVILSLLSRKLNRGMRTFSLVAMGVMALSMALSIIISSMHKLFKMDIPSDWQNRMLILGEILLGLGLLTLVVAAASSLSGSNNSVKAGPIIALAAALYLSVAALGKLFKMDIPPDYEEKYKLLEGLFAGFILAILAIGLASRISKDGIKATGTILAMCAFILTVTASLAILSLFPAEKLIAGAVGLGITLIALAIALAGASQITDKDSYKTILAMAIEIGVIVAALAILSMIPVDKLLISAGVLGTLLGVLALDFYAVSKITEKLSFISILAMALNIGVIAASLYVLSEQPWETLAAAGASLSAVLLSVAGAFAIISKSKVDTTNIAAFLLGTVGVIMVGVAISILATQPWESIAAAGGSISGVLLAMSGAFAIISAVKVNVMTFASFLAGILAIGAIGFVLYELASQPWESLLAAAAAISAVIISMSIAMGILTVVGAACEGALIGIVVLDAFIADLALVMVSLGYLQEECGGVMTSGGETLVKLGEYLGDFIGSIISGIGEGVGQAIANIGQGLTDFANNAEGFMDAMSNLDPNVLIGTKNLAEAILIITGAKLLDGITSFLGFGSMGDFGTKLEEFGEGIARFSSKVEGINPETVTAASCCAEALAGLYSNMPKEDGWMQKITGESKSLAEFAEELIPFGEALVSYSSTVTGSIDQEAVEASIAAAKVLAGFADTLPDMGGLKAVIFGDQKTLAEFAEELIPFGKALVEYSSTVTGSIDQEAVEASIAAAEVLKSFNDTLPDMGGLKAVIFGDQKTLAEFAEEIIPFGVAMASYSSLVAGKIDKKAVDASAAAAESLAKIQGMLGKSGGISSWFVGEQDMSDFGKSLLSFGESLTSYSDQISTIDVMQLALVISQVNMLADLATRVNDIDTSGMTGFAASLEKMADKGLDEFISTFTDSADKVESAISKLFKMVDSSINKQSSTLNTSSKTTGKEIVKNMEEGIESKKNSLTSTTRQLCNYLIDFMKSELCSSRTTGIGSGMIQALINGVVNKKSEAVEASKTIINYLIIGFGKITSYVEFYRIGEDLSKGFINGIKSQYKASELAGKDLADAAKNAAKKTLDEHSPSKEMGKIGRFAGLGFVNELMLYVAKAAKVGKDIGNASMDGIREVITDPDEYFSSLSDPVIKPIMDLSSVNSAFSRLQNRFNTAIGTTIELAGNVNTTISTSRDNNNELLSAIKDLKNNIDRPVVNNSYNIDGLSYSEDDETSKAFEDLVKAIKRRKRV